MTSSRSRIAREWCLRRFWSGYAYKRHALERRTRAERALTTVVATCYLKGVSTRRMNDLVASLGINNLSKSQVSEMAKDLDKMVEDFRTRPLDTGPYLYVSCDALTMKVRETSEERRVGKEGNWRGRS